MKKLDNVILKKGFVYELICRDNNKAIYSQSFQGKIISYEVFKIKVVKESVIFGKTVEEHEKFPSDNDFGITAWSCRSIDKARNIYDSLK